MINKLIALSFISIFTLASCKSADNTVLNQDSDLVSAQSTKKVQDKSAYKTFISNTNALTTTSKEGCRTTPDILGPYYLPNAPERTSIITYDTMERHLALSGTVYSSDCKTPLANATVEIWHADTQGNYSENVKDSYGNFRTTLKTDSKGKYSLSTMIPAPYDIGNNEFRPVHIHFKVTAKGEKDLVTQLYFKGDQYLAKDPWASKPDAKDRIIDLVKSTNGSKSAKFDIHL